MSNLREELKVPAFCPICGWMMKGQKSISTYYDYGCCIECFIYWLDGKPERRLKWLAGWRPSSEEIEARKRFFSETEES